MRAVLTISSRDNVATALMRLEAGQILDIEGRAIVVRDVIPAGHKIAIADIPGGSGVIKYGAPIGAATEAIACGAHVHTHNVASTRGRGDLPVSTASGKSS